MTPDYYYYLNQSDTYKVDGTDDRSEFSETLVSTPCLSSPGNLITSQETETWRGAGTWPWSHSQRVGEAGQRPGCPDSLRPQKPDPRGQGGGRDQWHRLCPHCAHRAPCRSLGSRLTSSSWSCSLWQGSYTWETSASAKTGTTPGWRVWTVSVGAGEGGVQACACVNCFLLVQPPEDENPRGLFWCHWAK